MTKLVLPMQSAKGTSRPCRQETAAWGETTWLNGAPAVRIDLDGELDSTVSLVIDDGRVTRIYAVRNPQKLGWLDEPVPLSR